MASEREGTTQTLSCGVCLEAYNEQDDRVPRLLPCTHTVCERCIKQLIRNNTLVCPVCRKKHRAGNNEKSFSQNMYILNHIHDKKNLLKEKQKCDKHKKELILFCLGEQCQGPICISCLKTDHKGHEWVEIEEHQKETLLKEMRQTRKNLEAKLVRIIKVKEDIDGETDSCLKILKKTRDDLIKMTDKMTEEAESQRKETNLKFDNAVSVLRNNMEHLTIAENSLIGGKEMNDETMRSSREVVKGIIGTNMNAYFRFPVFRVGQLFTERNLGTVTRGEILFQDNEDLGTEKQLPRSITSM